MYSATSTVQNIAGQGLHCGCGLGGGRTVDIEVDRGMDTGVDTDSGGPVDTGVDTGVDRGMDTGVDTDSGGLGGRKVLQVWWHTPS